MPGANAQMGTIGLERNGFLGTNPCSVSPKPIFGVILNLRSGGRIGGLGICTPGFRGSTVLASVGAGARPTAEAVLEKELKFSPAFRDYVKVLESIQTDRSKHPSSDSENSNARYRLAGNDGSGKVRNKEEKKMVEPRVGSQNRGIHAGRRLGSHSGGVQLTHERRDKYLRAWFAKSDRIGPIWANRSQSGETRFSPIQPRIGPIRQTHSCELAQMPSESVQIGPIRANRGASGKSRFTPNYRFGKPCLRDEHDENLKRDETKRNRRYIVEDALKKTRAWKGEDKSSGSCRILRNVSEHSSSNIMQGACNRYLNKKQVDYSGDVVSGESGLKQSEKHGRNEQIHGRETNGKWGGETSAIQDEDLKWNCTQPEKQHLNNLGKKMSRYDMGKSENNDKLFGGTCLPGNIFEGKMSDIRTLKSSLKKVSILKDNSESMLAKSEFTRDRMQKNMLYEIEMKKRLDESGTHGSRVRRDISPSRIYESRKGSIMHSSQCSVLDTESGRVQQNMNLDDMEIDATDHCGHSRRWTAFDKSTEINEEPINQGHNRLCGDAITKIPGSKISKIDRTVGIIHLKADKDAGEHVGNVDLNDRAAFKTFEVFTDIKNRPRVLRMELEERIQNLAKRLNATDVNMPEWKFSKLIHDAKIKFTDHSILRVVQILGAFGNWRRVLQVVEWLQSQERFKSYKSRYIYTTVLSVLGKAKRPMEAHNVFYAMRQELSSYPDLAAYHCIAVILGQAGLMKELFDVIDCMRTTPEKKFKLGVLQKWDPRLEPDLVVYNTVLNACVQQKQWEGAFWVLQELKQKGIQPSNTTYGLVMEVMLVCGKYNLVHEFFKKLQKSSIPGALNYKVLVNTFWREGKIDEAVLAVEDMERRGIVGSASLYYDLARCLCSAGRCQEALLQIDKLCKVAQKPLVVTYTGLIQTCLDSGSIQNATYVFNLMHKFCSPNVVTCNIMLKSYVQRGMFQEAKCLFQKILEGNKCINQKSDLKGKVVPDKFTFNTMMEACIDTKHWDDFEYAYEHMLHYGYHFDAKRHLRMVMEASRAGKVQLLDTTFEHLVCSSRTPPPAIVKERFCLRLQDGDCVAALSCLDISEPVKLQFYSEKAWLDTLNTSFSHFGKTVVTRLASAIESLPFQSHEKSLVLQNLLNACKKIINSSTSAIVPSDRQHALLCDDL